MRIQSFDLGGAKSFVMVITAVFIFLGSFASGMLSLWEPFLVLGMMLLLGLPHGATDHGLFLALQKGHSGSKKISFYVVYLGVIAAYGLIWWFLPVIAFAIFMFLSVYHFGQSNWVNTNHESPVFGRLHYLMWGTGILLTPILLHAGEAIAIVKTMTDIQFITAPERSAVLLFIGIMAFVNASIMFVLRWQQHITTRVLVVELVAYAILTTLFFTNSLLLGFSVYFVFWHSLDSAKDQLQFFKLRLSPALRRQLYGEISMTVLGALLFCLIVWFGPGPETALQPSVIGGVFIFISLLTLPHMLLVEQLYTRWSPVRGRSLDNTTTHQNKLKIITRAPDPAAEQLGRV
jgi:Brp/Blh family beta-carotene 15,15'-monooxygenase